MDINIPTTILALLVGWALAKLNDFFKNRKEARTSKNKIVSDLLTLNEEITKRRIIDNDIIHDDYSDKKRTWLREELLRRNTKDLKSLHQKFRINLEYLKGYDPLLSHEIEMLIENSYYISDKFSSFDEESTESFLTLLRLSAKLDERLVKSIDKMIYKISLSISYFQYRRIKRNNKHRDSTAEKSISNQKEINTIFEKLRKKDA